MNDDIKKLYDELINPQNGLNEDEFLEKLAKLEDYTTINIYRTLLSNNDKESVRTSKEYRALKGLNSFSIKQIEKNNIIRNRLERNAINKLVGKKVSISDIINIYSKNINKILKQKSDIRNILKELNIVFDKVEGTILPPEGQERIIPGSGKGIEEKKGFDRFSLLLKKVLNAENGFYIGDYRVVIGNNRKNMMRKTSYIVIEIPKINKTIFVNNEYGEATFIYDGIPLDTEIQEKGKLSYKAKFTKIKFLNPTDPTQWIEQVKEALNSPSKGENKFKDVKASELGKYLDREEKKKYIRELFEKNDGLKKQWFSLNTIESRRNFKIDEIGYIRIARIFGLKGVYKYDLCKEENFIKLSIEIFGKNDPNVKQLQKDLKKHIRELFKENNGDLEKIWFSLETPESRKSFKIDEIGYIRIARIFGLEVKKSNDLLQNDFFIELSKRIFRDENDNIDPRVTILQEKFKKYSTDDIKYIFAKDKNLQNRWFSLNTKTRSKFKINDGLGYIEIARIFGLKNEKFNNLLQNNSFIKLSIAIFGENDERVVDLQTKLKEYSKEEIQYAFMNDTNLQNMWFSLETPGSRKFFKFHNLGYKKIARIFGLEVKKSSDGLKDEKSSNLLQNDFFIELSKRIFCDENGNIDPRVTKLQENFKKDLKKHIRELFKENDNKLKKIWFSLNTTKSKREFKIDRIGYIGIARIFGLEGVNKNDLYKKDFFIKLSINIFGENDPRVINLINKKNK